MALQRIDDIHLYTGWTANAAACYNMINYLDNANVQYVPYHYNDKTVHELLFTNLNAGRADEDKIGDFPFLTYTEIHDDLPPSRFPKVYLRSVEEIEASSFLTDYQLGR